MHLEKGPKAVFMSNLQSLVYMISVLDADLSALRVPRFCRIVYIKQVFVTENIITSFNKEYQTVNR